MARITYYKNSFLASVISIISSFLGMFGFAMLAVCFLSKDFSDLPEILLTLAIALVGGAIASSISKNKSNTQWWQEQIIQKNLEGEIKNSVDFCFKVYNANPNQWTLHKIEQLNPNGAAQIRQALAAKQ